MKGYSEADTGRDDETAPVTHLESVRVVMTLADRNKRLLRQLGVETEILQARTGPDRRDVYVITPEVFKRTERRGN